MHVLMLGWEFPPHISGGLGTACLGITRGLEHAGVDVTFVVPHAHGDEAAGRARIVSSDAPGSALPELGQGGPPAHRPRFGRRAARSEHVARRLGRIRVPSALHPYLTARTFRTSSGADAPSAARGGDECGAVAAREGRRAAARRTLTGAYGPDLLSEVARYADAVAEIAARSAADVVHAHDWMTFPAGVAAADASGRPLVVHVHACEQDRCGDGADRRIEEIEREGTLAADAVVCVSRYTADAVRRLYGVAAERVRVVHNGLLASRARGTREAPSGRAVAAPLVLFLGRVTFQKGPGYFLRAAARVARVLPRAKFVVAGSGDLLRPTIELAAELGIARNVHFTGFLRGADVARMYGMADVYVMPSVSEPFGITALEAAARDVAVIVSRRSGVVEVLRNALRVDFWDVEDLADKVLALLRHRALREDLAHGGRDEARGAGWERAGVELRRIYEEVAAS